MCSRKLPALLSRLPSAHLSFSLYMHCPAAQSTSVLNTWWLWWPLLPSILCFSSYIFFDLYIVFWLVEYKSLTCTLFYLFSFQMLVPYPPVLWKTQEWGSAVCHFFCKNWTYENCLDSPKKKIVWYGHVISNNCIMIPTRSGTQPPSDYLCSFLLL